MAKNTAKVAPPTTGAGASKIVLLILLVVVVAGAIVAFALNPGLLMGNMGKDVGDDCGSKGDNYEVNCETLPDLVIEYVYFKDSSIPTLNSNKPNRYELRAVVKNIGGDMTEPVHLSFALTLDPYVTETYESMIKTGPTKNTFDCGETQEFTVGIMAEKEVFGKSRFIIVDALDEVVENNEGNNHSFVAVKNRVDSKPLSNGHILKGNYPVYYKNPAVSYVYRFYSTTLSAEDLELFGNSHVYTTGLTYYTSGLYAWDIGFAGLPDVEDWNEMNGYWYEGKDTQYMTWVLSDNNGHLIVAEELNKSGSVTNYSNLIYIPPTGEWDYNWWEDEQDDEPWNNEEEEEVGEEDPVPANPDEEDEETPPALPDEPEFGGGGGEVPADEEEPTEEEADEDEAEDEYVPTPRTPRSNPSR